MTTYKEAGVDIDKGNSIVEFLKPIAKATHNENILSGIGGFAAAFRIPPGYVRPTIVTCTDGVGTKLKLANRWNTHAGIGIDLVAMSVNDLVVLGAKPLAFLDYYASNELDPAVLGRVLTGIAVGCQDAECALVGGETAEMPGMYAHDGYELAGFCVGVVEADQMISGTDVKKGDLLIGLPSSGPHSNGYSLINKIIEPPHKYLRTQDRLSDGKMVQQALLAPTRIYHHPVKYLLQRVPLHAITGMAHITGGGLEENIVRMHRGMKIELFSELFEKLPEIFQWIQDVGEVDTDEMMRVFNCGYGYVFCVNPTFAETITGYLTNIGEKPEVIGQVTKV